MKDLNFINKIMNNFINILKNIPEVTNSKQYIVALKSNISLVQLKNNPNFNIINLK